MAIRHKRGSATIEGVIIFPLILLMLFGILGITFKIFNSFSVSNSMNRALRVKGYSWYDGKNLYDDILSDFNGTKTTNKKLDQTKMLYKELLQPSYKVDNAKFTLNNQVLYRSIDGKAGLIGASYPIYRGAIFVRGSQYARELLEDAFSHVEEDVSENQEVYIVDDSIDEYEYNRVYHLYSDCSYLKNGYKSKTTLREGRSKGFRVCRICLARKTGMD